MYMLKRIGPSTDPHGIPYSRILVNTACLFLFPPKLYSLAAKEYYNSPIDKNYVDY